MAKRHNCGKTLNTSSRCLRISNLGSNKASNTIILSYEIMQWFVQYTSQKDTTREQRFLFNGIGTILQSPFLMDSWSIHLKPNTTTSTNKQNKTLYETFFLIYSSAYFAVSSPPAGGVVGLLALSSNQSGHSPRICCFEEKEIKRKKEG